MFNFFRSILIICLFPLASQGGSFDVQDLRDKYPLNDLSKFSEIFKESQLQDCKRSKCKLFFKKNSFKYNAVSLTMLAGLKTKVGEVREHTWDASSFRKIQLNLLEKEKQFFNKSIYAKFRKTKSKKLFMIFSSTFSPSKSKTWITSTIEKLDQIYDYPNILIFPGMLSKSVLHQEPILPALSGKHSSADLYQRIYEWLGKIKESYQIGLIGYSGGATIALEINDHDAKNHRLFNLGGIYYSPIIDFSSTFESLDTRADLALGKGDIENDDNIFSLSDLAWLYTKGLSDWGGGANLLVNPPVFKIKDLQYIYGAFFQSFRTDDIENIFSWFHGSKIRNQTEVRYDKKTYLSNTEYFSDFLFGLYAEKNYVEPACLLGSLRESFDCYSDLSYLVKTTQARGLLVFTTDDPVHNKYDDKLSEGNKNFIEKAASNPNISLVHKKHGGHMGYLSFSNWLSQSLHYFESNMK